MKILYYSWFENSMQDMLDTFSALGYEVIKCTIPCSDYETDPEFTGNLEKILQGNDFDYIFSFNFFPLIARTAERLQIKYISWIYDSPHRTLCSPAVKGEYNYIFVFDSMQYAELGFMELPHLYHFPLAVNTTRLASQWKETDAEGRNHSYQNEISFVGSLYENNMYDQIVYLPDYLRGYLQGIIQAQKKVYGYNFIAEVLDDAVVQELNRYIRLDLDPSYYFDIRKIYADMINAKITAEERTGLLQRLSERHEVTLYTASSVKTGFQKIKSGGVVDYQTEMPEVFRHSKINLNITLRSIQSGIPLRALDIMGAGGFLLSNYQKELADCFIDGKELVLYGSEEELLYDTAYYLQHDKEREEIAYHGFQKVREMFSYEVRVAKMMDIVKDDN